MNSVISSANWALLTFSDTALAEWIWTPIYTWWSNLINLMIKFFPIFLLLAFFGLMLSLLYNIWKQRKQNNDKSLENK